MIETDKFERKDLTNCPWWKMPGQDYLIKLDQYCAELEEAYDQLLEAHKKATGKYYLADAHDWTNKYYELSREHAQLEGELYKLQSKYEVDMEAAETRLARKDSEIGELKAIIAEYQEAEKPKTRKSRDGKTGRFVSDVPQKEKIREAGRLYGAGYTYAQIANRLHVSADTAKKYVRTYEAQEKAELDAVEVHYWNEQYQDLDGDDDYGVTS